MDNSNLTHDCIITCLCNGEMFHMNKTGELLYDKKFKYVSEFSEGAAIAVIDNRYFHINTNGEAIYDKTFEYVGDFENGIAVAKRNGQCIYIDKHGNEKQYGIYEEIGPGGSDIRVIWNGSEYIFKMAGFTGTLDGFKTEIVNKYSTNYIHYGKYMDIINHYTSK